MCSVLSSGRVDVLYSAHETIICFDLPKRTRVLDVFYSAKCSATFSISPSKVVLMCRKQKHISVQCTLYPLCIVLFWFLTVDIQLLPTELLSLINGLPAGNLNEGNSKANILPAYPPASLQLPAPIFFLSYRFPPSTFSHFPPSAPSSALS
jgi:hypothetical protein